MDKIDNKIRTRFAPSPTGFLHIGNLRTVLFEYLTARSLGGKLILRIEDTDQKREVAGAVESLLDILNWIGIKFDEGPGAICGAVNAGPDESEDVGGLGPYIQTERLDIYQKYIKELIAKGEAYHCFCTEERLSRMRAQQEAMKMPPRYDRCCRNLSAAETEKRIAAGEKFVVRQKMPLAGEYVFHEELRGDLKFRAEELDDQVLMKSNGVPTYQLASVVDDHLMEISHVLRGAEWLSSFPKNILLYRSFGWDAPKFFHLSLIMNKGGGKLSKRQGDVSVEDFRRQGYLPEGLVNFLLLLGWHPEGDNEIIALAEAEKIFDCYKIGVSPAIFDLEKLDYFNGYHIRRKSLEDLVGLCRPYLQENLALTSDEQKKSDDFLKKVIKLCQERLKKLSDISVYTKFFFVDDLDYAKELLVWKKSTTDAAKANLAGLLDFLEKIGDNEWQVEKLTELVTAWLKSNNFGIGDYLWPMRVALTGEKASPSPFEMAWALGKAETLAKIKKAIEKLA